MDLAGFDGTDSIVCHKRITSNAVLTEGRKSSAKEFAMKVSKD